MTSVDANRYGLYFFWEVWVLYGCLFTINGHFGAKLKFLPLSTFDRINLETF